MRYTRPTIGALAALVFSACGGGEQGTGPSVGNKPLSIVSGNGVSDTVDARLPLALTVDVRVNGVVRSGVIVRFDAIPSVERPYSTTLQVASLASNQYGAFRADSTDASGRVRVLVKLGSIPGEVRLVVSVPEIGAADTARFTVRPGAVARLQLAVRDAAVRIGGTYAPGAAVADRYSNPRTETVSFDVGANAVSVGASGTVTVGSTVGRGFVVARFGTLVDTARFTVVPSVSIVSLYVAPDQRYHVMTSELDGSNRKLQLVTTQSAVYPSTTRSGGLIVFYEDGTGEGSTIYLADSTGARRRLLGTTPMLNGKHARFSADGQFVYFQGRQPNDAALRIFRVKADGTGLEQMTTPVASPYYGQYQPSSSADGTKLVFVDEGIVTVRTLATGATVRFSNGFMPVFSPDGQKIAYSNGDMLVVANATGGTPQTLSGPNISESAGVAWTSDSQWLMARSWDGVWIVNPVTRAAMLVPGSGALYQVALRQ